MLGFDSPGLADSGSTLSVAVIPCPFLVSLYTTFLLSCSEYQLTCVCQGLAYGARMVVLGTT